MEAVAAAEKILDSMLVKLGFQVELETLDLEDGPCLNIISEESALLIGKQGDRLEDLQYLTNRILVKHYPEAPRVKVDCDHYRAHQEEALLKEILELADKVLEDGKPRKIKPLNAYYRRLAHNVLSDVEGVSSHSPKTSGRYKRIEITRD